MFYDLLGLPQLCIVKFVCAQQLPTCPFLVEIRSAQSPKLLERYELAASLKTLSFTVITIYPCESLFSVFGDGLYYMGNIPHEGLKGIRASVNSLAVLVTSHMIRENNTFSGNSYVAKPLSNTLMPFVSICCPLLSVWHVRIPSYNFRVIIVTSLS